MIDFLSGLAIGLIVGVGVTAIILGTALKEVRAQLNQQIRNTMICGKHRD